MSVTALPSAPVVQLPITATPVTGPVATGLGAQPAADPSASVQYNPAQIRHAYKVDQLPSSLTGSGQTIGIVDAYNDPTIAGDLATFDSTFGLPAATLHVVPQTGHSSLPSFDSGWAVEISLDVEWAHAIAPGATILLVEAASNSFSDLLTGVDTAVAMGAKQVSMSWGGGDFSGENSYDYHFQPSGVTFVAASGDDGAGAQYPASSPYVTSVGGTTLLLDSSSNRTSEIAWSGSGGGPSSNESLPSFQSGLLGGTRRGVPDVSYDASPNTSFYIYDSSGAGGWNSVGGTSAGSPQWAALIALANQGRASASLSSLGTGVAEGTNVRLYQLAGGTSYTNPNGDFYDITSGSNGYTASLGYDLATGLGSPVANKLIPDLINAPVAQPPTLAPIADQSMAPYPATLAVTLNGSDPSGYSLTYSATAQSLPYVLNQSYQFYQDPNGLYQSSRGQQEKYLRAKVSASNYNNGGGDFWYYILPNGDLYEFTSYYTNPALVGTFVASLGTTVYNNPSQLDNAQSTVQSLPYTLNQSYQFYQDPNGLYQNTRGQQEKYLRGRASASNYSNGGGDFWYYILPNGDLYEFTSYYTNPALVGTFVAHLGASAYNDPSQLYHAQNTAVSLSVSGNQLTVAPNSGFIGPFFVIVTVDDGHGNSASQRFKVTVS